MCLNLAAARLRALSPSGNAPTSCVRRDLADDPLERIIGPDPTGDALLALGQMIEGAKPAPQRKLGRREDGAGSERRLPPAGGALIKRAGLDQAMASAAAARTDEAVGPPPLGQRRPALLLAAVLTVESRLAGPLLGLNLVPSHRPPPGPVSIVLLLYTHRLG